MKKFTKLSIFSLILFLCLVLPCTSYGAIKNIIHEGLGHLTIPDGSSTVYKTVYSTTVGTVTATGQSLVDITGLSNALEVNATYQFEAGLSTASSEAVNGNEYGVNYSVAGGGVAAQILGTLGTTTAQAARINALNAASPAFMTTMSDGGIVITGIVTTGTLAGNLTIQHLKVTAGTSTVYGNSYLKTVRIQ